MKFGSAILLGLFAASPAAEALAQSPRDVPITQDLRREEPNAVLRQPRRHGLGRRLLRGRVGRCAGRRSMG